MKKKWTALILPAVMPAGIDYLQQFRFEHKRRTEK
jgi:hypothetical protein